MRLHYYSRSEMENIPRYSVAQVIESYQFLAGVPNTTLKIDPSSFTGKAIIIGTSAAATHDDKVTPYGNRPGFLLHAVAMSNLLEKHFLHLSPGWVEVVLLILTIPTCVFFSFFFQQTFSMHGINNLRYIFPISIISQTNPHIIYPLVM